MRILASNELAIDEHPGRDIELANESAHTGDERTNRTLVCEERLGRLQHGAALRDDDLGTIGGDAQVRTMELLARDPHKFVERTSFDLVGIPCRERVDDLRIWHIGSHASAS